MPRTLTTDRGDAWQRLDLVLRRHLTVVDGATRTRIQAWIANGQVTINGSTVCRVSTRAAPGDIITVQLPAIEHTATAAQEEVGLDALDIPDVLDVLYEDDHLLAVDKAPGVVVHPTYRHTSGTLLNALLRRARAWPAGSRPSLVGRLDKLTSGIVIVAKTAAVHAALQKEMASNRTEKDYLAVVYGRVNVAGGEINLPLRHDRNDRRRMVASDPTGAPSVTRFIRLARAGGLSLLRCRLVTGRTHQIRVHLAARGWPIVGDPLYATSTMPATSRQPRLSPTPDSALAAALRAFPRQALHAWRVALTHPVTRARILLEAPVPRDVQGLLAASGLCQPQAALSL
jgi:23S rRNA pseudouridine1911/1915/1917 synthase